MRECKGYVKIITSSLIEECFTLVLLRSFVVVSEPFHDTCRVYIACRYISLRLDGRVRGSGVGVPPWQAMSLQLPPLKGIWGGALDGMDGKV